MHDSDVRMVGWSPWSGAQLIAAARTGTPIEELPGDFTVAEDGPGETYIVSSLLACRPYYWTQDAVGAVVHGDDLFAVAQQAGLPWRWDDDAVRTLALMRHLVGEQTLHRDIRRMPAGAILHRHAGIVTMTRADPLTAALDGPRDTDERAVQQLLDALAEMPGDPLLTLTAGMDSRLLLAALLHLGRRPMLWTAGPEHGSDRRVATAIARATGLEHHVVELDSADFLRHGAAITRRTGGGYLAGDWHSYLLLGGAAATGAPIALKGANGELARSFYADAGLAARTADHGPGALAGARLALTVRRGRARHADPIRVLDPLRGGDTAAWLPDRLAATCSAPRRPLARLDHFYALQRVRRFVGTGLHLAAATMPVASPFLDARWALAAARLPRDRKLGDAFHRAAIGRLAPELLRHPTATASRMRVTAPPGAWLRSAPPDMSYSPFDTVVTSAAAGEIVRDSPWLDRFADPAERAAIALSNDRWATELLLTLHFAGEHAAAVDAAKPPVTIGIPQLSA
ncbi:MAG: hypothetical protein JHC95_17730 [Solirubrobacteraceae bacterium]|nr:hypothetical protein [Solirubrobacteraceae bacterium]